jgi:hypothetical protein
MHSAHGSHGRHPARLLIAAALLEALLLSGLCGRAAAEDCPYTPAAGSAERKAIMDTLRRPVEAELKQRVVFVAKRFSACRGWAFLEAEPQQPDGRPVDWTITNYAGEVADGVCGGYVHALLVMDGGRWRLRAQVICASDVPWVSWAEEYGAPPELFPKFD